MPDNLIESTPSAYTYPLLIKQLLHTPLAQAAQQEIVYQKKLRFTYRDFHERIGRLASGLAALEVRHGCTVAVMDWDSHRYLECYFAVPMMGAVLMTVNVRLSPEQILYTINHAKVDVLLVHSDFIPLLEGIKDKLESVRRFVLLVDEPVKPATSIPVAIEYEAMLAAGHAGFDFPDFDENTLATTFYTTGTTGLPKGVYFSHRQLVLHTISMMAALSSPPSGQRFHRGDVYMPVTPMFHVHAWGMPYIATVLGVKQVYPGRYVPDLLMELIRTEGVTFSHCVPTILHMLLNSPTARDTDLTRWKVVIGGGPLPHGLAKAALERGIDIFTGYGMSETCPVVSLAQIKPSASTAGLEEQLRLRCKTGLPVPLVDIRVVDAEMRDLPHDGRATGEIVVRAPWLTQGYLHNPLASEQLWAGGYLHTQDVANIDGEGYLQITDRLKDVIKTGGEWVSSLELESLISQHPGVSEVAVIGIKDDKWGERPLALVVLKASHASTVTEEHIRVHVHAFHQKGVISKYAVPETIRIIEAIDKTSVGKQDKKTLRQKYG
ncbi:MAG TPA: fatty acid--CoA ligase [Burkholderiaceae bacterium]|nr:fatty acid--CoA ligase [Burkholderiaceae bacterium]